MRFREYLLVAVSVVSAIICIRLGVWQIRRLQERKASNAMIVSRLTTAPVPIPSLPRDTGAIRYRRAPVYGAYDYAHQIVLALRTRDGSPGVHILTPVHLPGTDTAILVNRGWVYSPDGVRADLTHWREGDSLNAIAYAEPFDEHRDDPPRSQRQPNAYYWIDTTLVRSIFPYPVFPFVLVLQGDSTQPNLPNVPPRIEPPPLDEGPHMSYAIQWFAFATIAIVGMVFFVRKIRSQA